MEEVHFSWLRQIAKYVEQGEPAHRRSGLCRGAEVHRYTYGRAVARVIPGRTLVSWV